MATPPFDLCMSHTKPGTPTMFRSSLVCKLQDSRGPRFARHHKMKPRSKSNDAVFVIKKDVCRRAKCAMLTNYFPRRWLKKLNTLKSPVQWSILVRMHQQKRDAFFTLQRTFAWISPAKPDG